MIRTILTRRSIRRYTSEPVSDAQLEQILRAAMAAPSANNQQPWQFVVIDERERLDRVPEFHPHAQMIRQAPVAIAVCADTDPERIGAMWVQDCAAATQNLLLAAHALDLGAVWLGIYPRPERVEGLRELLALPAPFMPFALVPIGHAAENPGPANRYDERRIHRNVW